MTSEHWTSLELLCRTLTMTLKTQANLNVTQFRLLAALQFANESNMAGFAEMLGVKQNVLTQAADKLVEFGYVTREKTFEDGRAKSLAITEAGERLIDSTDDVLKESFCGLFVGSAKSQFWTCAEGIIALGTEMGAVSVESMKCMRIESAFILSLALLREHTGRILVRDTGLSFHEARIMEYFDEVPGPVRAQALSDRLLLRPNNITRIAERLGEKGLLQKDGDENDKRAVFYQPTEVGFAAQRSACETFDYIARRFCYNVLDSYHRDICLNIPVVLHRGFAEMASSDERFARFAVALEHVVEG